MRDLTEEEFKLAPEWATHYCIDMDGIYFSHETGFALYDTISKSFVEEEQDCPLSCIEDCDKLITKRASNEKPFDISEHEFSDEGLLDVRLASNRVIVDSELLTSSYSKDDAIAIAKALGVTGEDLL